MLKPPSVAITPDSGTKSPGAGTPAWAAYPMYPAEKCPNTVIKKIAEYRNRPIGTRKNTGIPFQEVGERSRCQRGERVLEARRVAGLQRLDDRALRVRERADTLGMRLLARGRQLSQDAAPVVRIGAPADQAVLLEAIHQLGDVGAHAVLARSQIGQRQGFLGIRQKVEHRELRQGQSCRAQRPVKAGLGLGRRAQEREDEGVGRRAARAFSGTLAHALIMAHSRAVGHSAPAARYSCTVRTPTVKVMNYASSKFPPLPGNRATTRSIASDMNGSRDPRRSAA